MSCVFDYTPTYLALRVVFDRDTLFVFRVVQHNRMNQNKINMLHTRAFVSFVINCYKKCTGYLGKYGTVCATADGFRNQYRTVL